MTICIGIKLSECVVLAADSRRVVLPGGSFSDDYQKVVQIADTFWVAAAGNLTFTSYVIDLFREFQVEPLVQFLYILQPIVASVFHAQQVLYNKLQPDYRFLGGFLIGAYDRASDRLQLFGFSSDNQFRPTEKEGGIIGGTEQDRVIVQETIRFAEGDVHLIKQLFVKAIGLISKENPQIGPHGHMVTIMKGKAELEAF